MKIATLNIKGFILNDTYFVRSGEIGEEGVDAYMIFNNKTLVELATYFPTTQEECLKIQGIGAFKWDKYGEEIIQIIKEYFSVKETKKA